MYTDLWEWIEIKQLYNVDLYWLWSALKRAMYNLVKLMKFMMSNEITVDDGLWLKYYDGYRSPSKFFIGIREWEIGKTVEKALKRKATRSLPDNVAKPNFVRFVPAVNRFFDHGNGVRKCSKARSLHLSFSSSSYFPLQPILCDIPRKGELLFFSFSSFIFFFLHSTWLHCAPLRQFIFSLYLIRTLFTHLKLNALVFTRQHSLVPWGHLTIRERKIELERGRVCESGFTRTTRVAAPTPSIRLFHIYVRPRVYFLHKFFSVIPRRLKVQSARANGKTRRRVKAAAIIINCVEKCARHKTKCLHIYIYSEKWELFHESPTWLPFKIFLLVLYKKKKKW